MIEMIKNSAISFHIKVDIHGIKQMLSYIEEKDISGKGHLQLIYLGKNRRFEIELNQVIAKLAKLVCDLDSKQERIRAEHSEQ